MIDWDKHVLAPTVNVFGESVTYLPLDGQPFMIIGVFDEAYKSVDLNGGMGITTEMPVLGVRTAQFGVLPMQRDKLTIIRTGVTYVVKEVQPDGHGSAKLMLNYVDE